jgi:hypothetical protein
MSNVLRASQVGKVLKIWFSLLHSLNESFLKTATSQRFGTYVDYGDAAA